MDGARDLVEKRLLWGVGVMLTLFGGTLLLMGAFGLGLALVAPFMGEAADGLRAAGSSLLALAAAAGCLWGGLGLRGLPLTAAGLARSAAEAVAFLVTAFWGMRISTGLAAAWEKAAYLLLLALLFLAGLNRFRRGWEEPRPGAPVALPAKNKKD